MNFKNLAIKISLSLTFFGSEKITKLGLILEVKYLSDKNHNKKIFRIIFI